MCGIVGAIAQREVTPILLEGLKRLEYRGYDSAGLVVVTDDKQLQQRRVKGKVNELVELTHQNPTCGKIGIAHTRWATHGEPSEKNAHPHISDNIVVVHNGIIENHDFLRHELTELGYRFISETDTELVAHFIHYFVRQGLDLLLAIQQTMKKLEGAYALGVLQKEVPDRMIAVRHGCPLVIGLGTEENFFASDISALLSVAERFIYLEEDDVAEIHRKQVLIFNKQGERVERVSHLPDSHYAKMDKGQYHHFMLKEIEEQPQAIIKTLEGRLNSKKIFTNIFGDKAPEIFQQVKAIQITACGTSYHAGLVAKYWLEEHARIPCQIEVASEWRYRNAVVPPHTLFVVISQSGETADTLAALRQAKGLGYLATLAICNVAQSSLIREADLAFLTHAGIEIGVASTKGFSTQLVALLMMTLVLSRYHRPHLTFEQEVAQELHALPTLLQQTLDLNDDIKKLAHSFADKAHTLFLGRGTQYPIALEGALKLKELSYIHAEAYPAGELKHGPLALVDKEMPIIAVAPNDGLIEKLKSNLHEVRARGGLLYIFSDNAVQMKNSEGITNIYVPPVHRILAPIVYTIPMQLLAYHVAVLKGTDVDQPRNLAKSVTVE